MSLELVQTVPGHATAKIVMQHYFKPQRKQLKTAMQNCLPGLLSSTAEPFTPAERAAEVLRAVDGKMNKADICMRVEEALTILTGSGKQKADFFHYRLVQPGVYTDILGWTDLF